jgi:twitching motility two-component system response regulator PilH
MASILIVDDSNTEVHVFTKMLEKHGYEILVAKTGEEGIELAQQNKPDLILMDIVMPGMDGFQATRKLSKNAETANIPIIIISTKSQQTDKIWGMRQGAKDYLIKPVTENTLISKIKSVLAAGPGDQD